MRILSILLSTLLALTFVACSKVPFAPQKPKSSAALVYVYAGMAPGDTERVTKYRVHINGKATKDILKDDEYVTYDLKAGSITITGSRNDIERHSVELVLQAGKTYYFKLQSISDDFGKFEFTQVEEAQALDELNNTTLAGAYDTSDSVIEAFVGSDDEKKVNSTQSTSPEMSQAEIEAMIEAKVAERTTQKTAEKVSSSVVSTKLDDIKSAYDMKKQGLLTDEEFNMMKAEILKK